VKGVDHDADVGGVEALGDVKRLRQCGGGGVLAALFVPALRDVGDRLRCYTAWTFPNRFSRT
jgi:hypothetical protein